MHFHDASVLPALTFMSILSPYSIDFPLPSAKVPPVFSSPFSLREGFLILGNKE
jgi:hypothetical protein